MKETNFNFLRERDFNVRVSVLDETLKGEEAQNAYEELIRDSLGIEIVSSQRVFIGNCVILKSNEEIKNISFESKGVDLINTLAGDLKESIAVRFNIRLRIGGYKSWIITRNSQMYKLLSSKDFNVRASIVDANSSSVEDKIESYINLVRDSLGESIVGNPNTIIGNLVIYRGDGTKTIRPFQYKGNSFIPNIKPTLRRCQAIRINVRLKQGGFKSWVIARTLSIV